MRRGTLRTHFELSKEDRLGHLKAGSFRKHGPCRANENFAADGEFPPPSTEPRVVNHSLFLRLVNSNVVNSMIHKSEYKILVQ